MAVVKPFKAVRPAPELASKVAALPYDVMNTKEAREMVKGNPVSFLHIDKAEIDLPDSVDHYDKLVYETARDNLNKAIANGTFVQDDTAYFYVYKQVMCGRAQIGIVACASIDDYINNDIKKHEHTRADKEQDRINHVDYLDANTGPIFLTYKARKSIDSIVNDTMKTAPLYDFVSAEGVAQTVWVIKCPDAIKTISAEFAATKSLYIADGHHRCASGVKVGQMRREQFPDYSGNEEFNFFMCVLFPDDQLYIMDYNRVVHDLNGLSDDDFLATVAKSFDIAPYAGIEHGKPVKKHSFGMYFNGKWSVLTAKAGTFNDSDPVERLDVSILQANLLDPILGIKDPRTDTRIDFVGGIRGLAHLEERVKNGMKVAFAMFPTSIEDLIDIADAGKIMPPKSTWFEPKLLSGLFIHKLK